MRDAGDVAARRRDALRVIRGEVDAAWVRQRDELAWAALLDEAGSRLWPWIARQLATPELTAALPAATRDRLAAVATGAAVDLLKRRAALGQLAEVLERAGIPFAVLKGMGVAHTLYPDPALRPMGDIDLWIGDGRRDEAHARLSEHGWQTPLRHRTLSAAVASGAPLAHEGLRALLELHDDPPSFARLGREEVKAVWARRVLVAMGRFSASTCAPDDLAVHLLLHVVDKTRLQDGLLALLDLTLYARQVEARGGWPALGAAHRARGISAWSALAFTLCRDLFAAPVPEAFFHALGAWRPGEALLSDAQASLWERDVGPRMAVPTLRAIRRDGIGPYLRSLHLALQGAPASPRRAGEAPRERPPTSLNIVLAGYVQALRRGALGPSRVRARLEMLDVRERLAARLEAAQADLMAGGTS